MQESVISKKRNSSLQFNHSGFVSDRATIIENEKSGDDNETDFALANQFQGQNSKRKKSQENYFKHKGDANVKIGSNIDFILESEQPEMLKTNSGPDNYQEASFLKTISQNTNDNERVNYKKSETVKTDEPLQRNNSEEFRAMNSQKMDTWMVVRKHFSVGMKVQKFVHNILSFQPLKNFYHLKQFQLSIINDPICSHISELSNHKQKSKGQFLSRLSKAPSQFKNSNLQSGIENQQSMMDKVVSALVNSTTTCFSKLGIIHPQSKFKVIWQGLHLMIMLMILFILPVEVALFETDFVKLYPYKFKGLSKGAFGFFFFDILVQLNTGVFDRGTILTDRQELARRYFKNNIWLDLLTAITLFAKELGFPKYINLLILCKIPAFQKILDELQEANLSKSNHKFQNILKLIRLVIELLFIAHLYACFFLYINSVEVSYFGVDRTWMTVYAKNINFEYDRLTWHANISKQQLFLNYQKNTRYMQAFYFCVTTMTTVGYGDIIPQNQVELIFCIFSLLTLCGVFAYSFNLVGVIVQDINKKSKDFKRDICLVNFYMEKLSISNELKYQVRKYLEYQHNQNEDISLSEEQYILNKLSPSLKEKLTLDAHMQLIKKSGGVFSQFSEEFLEKVCLNFGKQKFSKGDIIFKPYQKELDPSFYFIDEGEVDLYFESPSIQFQNDLSAAEDEKDQNIYQEKNLLDLNTNINVLKTLETNIYFGELSFFTNGIRSLGAICKKNGRCFVIQRSKFLKLIKKYPKDFEMYCKLRDKMIIDQSGQAIGTQCFSCKRYGHTLVQCHLIQSKIDREKLFLSENKTIIQNRNEVKKQRRRRFKFSALGELQNVQEKVELKKISLNNFSEYDEEEEEQLDDSQEIQSIDQQLSQNRKQNRYHMKQSKTNSYNHFDTRFRQNSNDKLKSHNYMKQSSMDSKSQIQTDDDHQDKSHHQLAMIEEDESVKESSPLKPKRRHHHDLGDKDHSPRGSQMANLSKYSEMFSAHQQQRPQIFPQQQFSPVLPHQNQQQTQQQQMLANLQSMLQKADQESGIDAKRISSGGAQSTSQSGPDQQYPLSPELKPSGMEHTRQQFGYRLLKTDMEVDQLALFQQQFAAKQMQQQPVYSILHENTGSDNNQARQHRQVPASHLQQYQDPFTQFMANPQHELLKKSGEIGMMRMSPASPNHLENSAAQANKVKMRQVKEDTPYVIEEYMQEFRVYYPEYNYSLIKFRFPRTTKEVPIPHFGKYTYFNRQVVKKADRKKSRKQSERNITYIQSNSNTEHKIVAKLSLLNQ